MRKDRFFRLLAVLMATGLWALDCQIEAGYGGVVPRHGRLVPVIVTIRNDAEQVQGQIEITKPPANIGQETAREVTEYLPFISPAPSTKRFVLYTRMMPRQQLEVRVRASRRFDNMARQNWTLGGDRLPVLLVGQARTWWQSMQAGNGAVHKDMNTAFKERYLGIGVGVRDLPGEALGYDAANMLVIGGINLPDLQPTQVNALARWVRVGGRLVILQPMQDWQSGQLARRLGLGADFDSGVRTVGSGAVAVDRSPLSNPRWLAGAHLEEARRLFPPLAHGVQLTGFGALGDGGGIFRTMVSRGGSYGLLGFVWLALIIGSYLVVIGPLDWLLATRLHKPWVTWACFLGGVAVFSVIAYGYSTVVHSGVSESVTCAVLDLGENGGPARGEAINWYYSNRNASYRLSVDQPNAVLSARETSMGLAAVAGVSIVNGVQQSELEARIPVFSSKTFDLTWLQDESWRVRVQGRGPQTEVRLPPELTAVNLWLVDGDELRELTYSGKYEAWRPNSRAHKLEEYARDLARRLEREDGKNEVADTPAWRDYLLFCALARRDPNPPEGEDQPEPEDQTAPGGMFGQSFAFDQLGGMLDTRDARERALSRVGAFAGSGRLLLILLAPDAGIVPIRWDDPPTRNTEIVMLRVQLPD